MFILRIKDTLKLPKASTAFFSKISIAIRGSILWNNTPDVIKSSNHISVLSKRCNVLLYISFIKLLFISLYSAAQTSL